MKMIPSIAALTILAAAFVSAQEFPPAGQFRFGIAYGHGPDNSSPEVAKQCAEIGIDLARGHIAWGKIQPKKDAWDWTSSDQVIDAHAAAGIEVQILLSGAPGWAWKEGFKVTEHVRPHTIPPRTDVWRSWCRAVAERYKGRVRLFEIWNEPDIAFWAGTQDEYMELLKAASEEIRAVNPDAVILTGGFASMAHKETKPGMIRRVLAEGRDSFDRVAYHRHGFFDEFAREVDGYLIPLVKAMGNADKPLHFTETAMDTRNGERHQAATLVKKITFAKARGAVAHTWFNFHDFNPKKSPPTLPGKTYGLYTREGVKKLSATAYKVLIEELRDTVPVKQYELAAGHWAFLFKKKNGAHVVVAWTEKQAGPLLAFRTNAGEVVAKDILGKTVKSPVREKIFTLSVAPDPVYYDFPADSGEPELLPVTAELTSRPLPEDGAQELLATFRNPFAKASKVTVKWDLPEGFQGVDTSSREIVVGAGETENVRGVIRPAEGNRFLFPARMPAGLEYAWETHGLKGELRVEVRANVIPLGRGAFPKGFNGEDLRLADEWQVERLAEHDPNSMALVWQGWNDLHSKLWFRRDTGATRIRILRRDEELAAGDGTRIVLRLPDGKHVVVTVPGDEKTMEATVEADGVKKKVPIVYDKNTLPIRVLVLNLEDSVTGLDDAILKTGLPVGIVSTDDDGSGVETRIHPEGPGIPESEWPVLRRE